MDILSNSINEKMNEIEEKIQKIKYIQEFDIARDFEKIFLQTKENIKKMKKAESQTHLYYHEAMDALDAINFEIDDYMEKEGKSKEQELNRTIFLEKLKRFIDDTKGKSSEQMLADLKNTVQEIKELEIEEDLFSEMYSLTAKAALSTFLQQAKNSEVIDLEVIEEVTTKAAFAKEIQNQLATMAEEQKEDKVATYDILKVCQEVNEQMIGDLKVWQTLSGDKGVQIKQPEPKKELPAEVSQETGLISLEPSKRTIVDWFRDRFGRKDGTSIYTFGKFNEKTGQYENIRVEQHRFPPRGTFFERRCQNECIGLEINGEYRSASVEIGSIAGKMPNLQNLIFGRNIEYIEYGKYEAPDSFGRNQYLPSLKRVEFSDDVRIIRDHLFAGCENLTEVKFGKNIERIGEECFWNCGLEEVTLPDKLRKIDCGTFCACRELKEVKCPEKFLSRIEKNAFLGCRSLEKVELPESMGEIQKWAFADCRKLKTIKFPEHINEVEGKAFHGFKNDMSSPIQIHNNLTAFTGFDEGVYLESEVGIYKISKKSSNAFLELVKRQGTSQGDDSEYYGNNRYFEEKEFDVERGD